MIRGCSETSVRAYTYSLRSGVKPPHTTCACGSGKSRTVREQNETQEKDTWSGGQERGGEGMRRAGRERSSSGGRRRAHTGVRTEEWMWEALTRMKLPQVKNMLQCCPGNYTP
eukprot:366038-Chlamydomonas_euryale.AAC.9